MSESGEALPLSAGEIQCKHVEPLPNRDRCVFREGHAGSHQYVPMCQHPGDRRWQVGHLTVCGLCGFLFPAAAPVAGWRLLKTYTNCGHAGCAGLESCRAPVAGGLDVERLAAVLDDFDNPALGPWERAAVIAENYSAGSDWTHGHEALAERMHEIWVLSGRVDPFGHDMEQWRAFAIGVMANVSAHKDSVILTRAALAACQPVAEVGESKPRG